MTTFIDSHLRCPRSGCGKRLVQDIGQDENHGDIAIRHECISCGYSEQAPRTVADARRRSDVPALVSMREQLARLRLGGVEVPLVYDATPWPNDFDTEPTSTGAQS